MGTFSVTIEIGDAQGIRFERMDALVDTGATYPVIPRDVLYSLGCQAVERRPFALADESIVEYDVGVVSLRLDDRSIPVVCVFGDEGSEPLLGAVALENFLLAADQVHSRLIPVPGKLK